MMKLLVTIAGREHAIEISDDRRSVSIDGEPLAADIAEVEPGVYSVLAGGRSHEILVKEAVDSLDVYVGGSHYSAVARDPRRSRRGRGGAEIEGRHNISAPMPGRVVRILVEPGQQVEAGQGVVVVEAMKMQNEIKSPKAGAIVEIKVAAGATVSPGQALAVVE